MKKQRETIWRRDMTGAPTAEADVLATAPSEHFTLYVVRAVGASGRELRSRYTVMCDAGLTILKDFETHVTHKAALEAARKRLAGFGADMVRQRYYAALHRIEKIAEQQLRIRHGDTGGPADAGPYTPTGGAAW